MARHDDPRHGRNRTRASWLDDDRHEREAGHGGPWRGRDDDDYTRELSGRYGHGEGGYDRGAYAQGGYGDGGHDQGGYGQGASGPDHEGPRGGRTPRSHGPWSDRSRSYSDGPGADATPGEGRFRTGVFMGGTDQDYASGGQYQGESGYGARSGYGGDYAGGGYLGRGSGGPRPQREGRSGGSFGDDVRGWHGPGGSGTGSHWGQAETRQGPRGGHRGRGPKNYTRTDARITEDLCERLTHDDDVDAGDIEVMVKDGVATLTGTVPERWMKHRAEDLAEACGGIQDVDNRLRVSRAGGSPGGTGAATPASS